MRLWFAGSGEFSLPVLRRLLASDHQVVGVLTAPDRKGSRGLEAPRPVRELALAAGVAVDQPARLTAEVFAEITSGREAEAMAVAAYGQLVPGAVLESLPQGALGVHPSLLPRHRGASPVAAAILAGDARSGVTVFRMERRLDAGPILAQRAMPLFPEATTGELTQQLAELGSELLVLALDEVERGEARYLPQLESGATYAERLSRRDGELDFSRSAEELDRRLRALSPWPGVTVPLAGVRVKLLAGRAAGGATGPVGEVLTGKGDSVLVGTSRGAFRVDLVQSPGGKPMSPGAFLRGRRARQGAERRG